MTAVESPPAAEAASRRTGEPLRVRPLLAAGVLCRREIVRFLRQRNRVVGALGQPVLFWLLLSVGFGETFRIPTPAGEPEVRFGVYYFPGTLAMILLFTAIFATVSVIEDRREGFLQSVLVSPIPRWSMVLGKVLGGSLLAMLPRVAFLAVGPDYGTWSHADFAGRISTVHVRSVGCADVAGAGDRLADGLHAGFSRGDDAGADADVAAVWSVLPRARRSAVFPPRCCAG